MLQPPAQNFRPPTAAQMRELLASHPPKGPSPWVTWLPMIALALAVVLTFTVQQGPLAFASWPLLLGVLAFVLVRARLVRRSAGQVAQLQELAMLRHHAQVLRLTWRLIPRLATTPELHGRTVALMAHCLDQVGAYDSAIVAYDYLIDRIPSEHVGSVQLRLARTMAQLANDQLADADDALRRLRSLPLIAEAGAPNLLRASYRLATLMQQVRTRHWSDAVESSAGLVDELRPLGVEAGYGHALMALSFHEMRHKPEASAAQEAMEPAASWWSRATLLLPTSALLARFSELEPLLDDPELAEATSSATPPLDSPAPQHE